MHTRHLLAALCAWFTLFATASFAQTSPNTAPTKSAGFPITATINTERVNVRESANSQSDRITLIDREARVTITAQKTDWIQIRTPDGRSGWIQQQFANPDKPLPIVAPVQPAIAATQPAAKDVNAAAAAISATSKKPQTTPQTSLPPVGKTANEPAPSDEPKGALAGTKNDLATRDNPAASAGEAWKLFVYLVPTLLVILFAIRSLKRLQSHPILGGLLAGQRTGTMPQLPAGIAPSPKQSLVDRIATGLRSGANLTKARETGGSSIRLIESVPIAGFNLCLVGAKDRILLLGAGSSGITVLSEWEAAASTVTGESFESSLSRASRLLDDLGASDMTSKAQGMRVSDALLAAEGPGLRSVVMDRAYADEVQQPASGAKGLDAAIRQAKEAIVRASRQNESSQFATVRDRAEFHA